MLETESPEDKVIGIQFVDRHETILVCWSYEHTAEAWRYTIHCLACRRIITLIGNETLPYAPTVFVFDMDERAKFSVMVYDNHVNLCQGAITS